MMAYSLTVIGLTEGLPPNLVTCVQGGGEYRAR